MMDKYESDPIRIIAVKMFDKNGPSKAVLRNNVLNILYSVGVIGVKKASFSTISWSQRDEPIISENEIKNSTQFEIHPMLHSALGIRCNHRR